MLTQEQINQNKEKFIELIKTLPDYVNVEGLLNYLEESDFFNAPASTQYHGSYVGGLCEHSLLTYKHLCELVNLYASHEERKVEEETDPETGFVTQVQTTTVIQDISDDSIKLVALLHDISKANYYESFVKNVPSGVDNNGKTIWTKEVAFKVKAPELRFICSDSEVNSAYIANRFAALTTEEFAAIANHSAGMADKYSNNDLHNILSKHKLVLLLHLAEMLATYNG